MTFDLRRRLRRPSDTNRRPRPDGTQEEFDAWYQAHDQHVLDKDFGGGGWINVPNAFARLLVATSAERL